MPTHGPDVLLCAKEYHEIWEDYCCNKILENSADTALKLSTFNSKYMHFSGNENIHVIWVFSVTKERSCWSHLYNISMRIK